MNASFTTRILKNLSKPIQSILRELIKIMFNRPINCWIKYIGTLMYFYLSKISNQEKIFDNGHITNIFMIAETIKCHEKILRRF